MLQSTRNFVVLAVVVAFASLFVNTCTNNYVARISMQKHVSICNYYFAYVLCIQIENHKLYIIDDYVH